MSKAIYKFLCYMAVHKWLVGKELVAKGMWWNAIVHDMDKFWLPDAIAYILHNHDDFKNRPDWQEYRQLVQLRHNHYNRHQLGYWVDEFGNALRVPIDDLEEMMIDWKVASQMKGDNPCEFIKNIKSIHPLTLKMVKKEFKCEY